MGKSKTHIVVVPRAVTIALLVLVSAAMAALIYWLTGRAVLHERASMVDIIAIIRRYDTGQMPPSAVLATLAPAISNILFFVPWGALAFLSFDRPTGRRRLVTYGLTLAVGAAFASGLVVWQFQLPTRVTGWPDAAWNTLGVAIGAMAGHLRKEVRVRFG